MKNLISYLENKVYEGKVLNFNEALEVSKVEDLTEIYSAADRIRHKFNNNSVDLCSIMNAKSGRCSEDCKYCSQSAHYKTDAQEYDMVSKEKALKLALENEESGAKRFSLVTSGRGINGEEFNKVIEIYKFLKKRLNISLCASLGIINYDQLVKLKEVGVSTYHHNLETSREYYKRICTTHTYDERIETIKNAQKAGLNVCSGGIIGMGEGVEDRINLALNLRELNIQSIPINILNPIKGTPMQNMKPLSEEEILKSIAVFRFVNPKAHIRLAGGRNLMSKFGEEAFKAGASALITGNYLTTCGNNIKDDIEMLNNLGLEVMNNG